MELQKSKRGRPKGKTRQPVTVMLLVDDIIRTGGMEAVRTKIQNTFSKQ
jgi:hypothetical protein